MIITHDLGTTGNEAALPSNDCPMVLLHRWATAPAWPGRAGSTGSTRLMGGNCEGELPVDGTGRRRPSRCGVLLRADGGRCPGQRGGEHVHPAMVARASRYRADGGIPGLDYLPLRFLPRLAQRVDTTTYDMTPCATARSSSVSDHE